MIKKSLAALFGLVVCAAFGVFLYLTLNKSPKLFEESLAGIYNTQAREVDQASEVSIQSGKLVGFGDNYGTYAWLGIPYAQAPIDSLRWRAPQPPLEWSNTHKATQYVRPACSSGVGSQG